MLLHAALRAAKISCGYVKFLVRCHVRAISSVREVSIAVLKTFGLCCCWSHFENSRSAQFQWWHTSDGGHVVMDVYDDVTQTNEHCLRCLRTSNANAKHLPPSELQADGPPGNKLRWKTRVLVPFTWLPTCQLGPPFEGKGVSRQCDMIRAHR